MQRSDPFTLLAQWLAAAGRAGVHAMLIAGASEPGDVAGCLDEALDGERTIRLTLGDGATLFVADTRVSRERWQALAQDCARRPGVRVALARGVPGEGARSLLQRLRSALDAVSPVNDRAVAWATQEGLPGDDTMAELSAELFPALAEGAIELRYQAQYAPDGVITGAEALARWQHARLGTLDGAVLFAVAERAGAAERLSATLAEQAMRAAARWPDAIGLSLNVTPSDLVRSDFADAMLARIGQSGLVPARLTLEITEHALLDAMTPVRMNLDALHASGVRIALDDFGAGFCNFRYLKLLPLASLKLDRSMVEGVADDPRDRAVLRGIVAMACALDLAVTAEGVETEEQRRMVVAEGCANWQGFLGSHPLDAARFEELLRA